jgi:NhaP-type Na+/H+ or K+/H+ antiporter
VKTILVLVSTFIVGIVFLVYPIPWLAGLAFGGLIGYITGVGWMHMHFKQIAPEEYRSFKEKELKVLELGVGILSDRHRKSF